MKTLILTSYLALSACGPTGDRAAADRASAEQAVAVTNAPGPMAAPPRRAGDPVAKGAENVVVPANAIAVEPGSPATPAPTAGLVPTSLPTSIPDQFQGRWGLTRADCTSTRGDNKGLLVIGDKQLKFYEARGTLDRTIAVPAAARFEGAFNLTGEGQTWTRIEKFDVKLDTLRRRTDKASSGEPPIDLEYKRCPA